MILKSGGNLEQEYSKYAKVYNLEKDFVSKSEKDNLFTNLKLQGYEKAITNTVVSGDIVDFLYKNSIEIISLIHEMPNFIKIYKMEKQAELISKYSSKVIFPSNIVLNGYKTITDLSKNKSIICPQGLYQVNKHKKDIA